MEEVKCCIHIILVIRLVKFIYTVKNASEVHEKSSKQYR
jgi:hypothetical protein